jgi:hypothetical protein
MSGTIGSTPTTEIISEGLVFNVDARLRASVLKPLNDPLNVYNTVAESNFGAGVCSMTGMTSLDNGGNLEFAYINPGPTNNNWVTFNDMSTLNLTGTHSSEFVIYNNNVFGPAWPAVYSRGQQSSLDGYWWVYLGFGGDPDVIYWQYSLSTGSITAINGGTVIPRNTYTHIIMSIDYENLEFKIYVNGVWNNTQALSSVIRNVLHDQMLMGTYYSTTGSNYGFTGNIPILRFYDRVLNEDEVTHNFTAIKNYYAL